MKQRVEKTICSVTVNGTPRDVAVEPRRTLLNLLREDLGLTGAKEVCAMGDCGACTVLLDGETVYSCLVLAVECEGRDVQTIEGLAQDGQLTAVQRAFVEDDAFQCGYCTSGQILSLEALFASNAKPSDEELARAVTGNLCRCGAYQNILAAARRARDLQAASGSDDSGAPT